MFDDPYLRWKWLAIALWLVIVGRAIYTTFLPH